MAILSGLLANELVVIVVVAHALPAAKDVSSYVASRKMDDLRSRKNFGLIKGFFRAVD